MSHVFVSSKLVHIIVRVSVLRQVCLMHRLCWQGDIDSMNWVLPCFVLIVCWCEHVWENTTVHCTGRNVLGVWKSDLQSKCHHCNTISVIYSFVQSLFPFWKFCAKMEIYFVIFVCLWLFFFLLNNILDLYPWMWNPGISLLSTWTLLQEINYHYYLVPPSLLLIAVLFLTPYSINIIVTFIITHQQKVTKSEEWICKLF